MNYTTSMDLYIDNDPLTAHIFSEYTRKRKEKYIFKMFTEDNPNSSHADLLKTFNRTSLHKIRQNYKLKNVSKFKKSQLLNIISNNLLQKLPIILNNITHSEYRFILKIIFNNGILKLDNQYIDIFLYLREYGLVYGVLINDEKYFYIPADILELLKISFNTFETMSKIKTNEKIYRLTKALLNHYGILNLSTAEYYINQCVSKPFSPSEIIDLLCEFTKKRSGIVYYKKTWLCSDITDYSYLKTQINKLNELEYRSFNLSTFLEAEKDNSTP